MDLLTYDPSSVILSIAGLYTVEGYADGTFIKISKDEKPFVYHKAMDGNLARLYRKDDTYSIKLMLVQSSPSNNVLAALHTIDLSAQIGTFPIMFQDCSGTAMLYSSQAWIEYLPDIDFSKNIEVREWSIRCTNAVYVPGGNTSTNVADILNISPQLASITGVI